MYLIAAEVVLVVHWLIALQYASLAFIFSRRKAVPEWFLLWNIFCMSQTLCGAVTGFGCPLTVLERALRSRVTYEPHTDMLLTHILEALGLSMSDGFLHVILLFSSWIVAYFVAEWYCRESETCAETTAE